MAERVVGVLGARTGVGAFLIEHLVRSGCRVIAYSRQPPQIEQAGVEWRQPLVIGFRDGPVVEQWISLLPIWVLPDYFWVLERHGIRRIVALSSTSRFVKLDASSRSERLVAESLVTGESVLEQWAANAGMQWTILRPTLIYGRGRDRNIAEVSRFIRRFGFFPLGGQGRGLRQPVHAEDVAAACVAALDSGPAAGRAYNLSGGDTLSYRDMVIAIFRAMGRQPRFIPVPLWFARIASPFVRLHPRFHHWRVGMLERMKQDLVFDHAEAERDLGFAPRGFALQAEDLGL